MFVRQALAPDPSCQRAVNGWAAARVAEGLTGQSIHTGGYCRARQRLPLSMVRALALSSGRQLSERALEGWRWRARRVKLLDGTGFSMPDTPENQSAYPQPSSPAGGRSSASSGPLDGEWYPMGPPSHSVEKSFYQAGELILEYSVYANDQSMSQTRWQTTADGGLLIAYTTAIGGVRQWTRLSANTCLSSGRLMFRLRPAGLPHNKHMQRARVMDKFVLGLGYRRIADAR